MTVKRIKVPLLTPCSQIISFQSFPHTWPTRPIPKSTMNCSKSTRTWRNSSSNLNLCSSCLRRSERRDSITRDTERWSRMRVILCLESSLATRFSMSFKGRAGRKSLMLRKWTLSSWVTNSTLIRWLKNWLIRSNKVSLDKKLLKVQNWWTTSMWPISLSQRSLRTSKS